MGSNTERITNKIPMVLSVSVVTNNYIVRKLLIKFSDLVDFNKKIAFHKINKNRWKIRSILLNYKSFTGCEVINIKRLCKSVYWFSYWKNSCV